MKFLFSMLLVIIFSIPREARPEELEVYICGWHEYGYDCLLIIDPTFDYTDIDYDQ